MAAMSCNVRASKANPYFGCSTTNFSPPIASCQSLSYCRHAQRFSPYKVSGWLLTRRRWSGWRSRFQCAPDATTRAWRRVVWLGGHGRAVSVLMIYPAGLPTRCLTQEVCALAPRYLNTTEPAYVRRRAGSPAHRPCPRRASRVRTYALPRATGPGLEILHAVLAGLYRLEVA